MTGITSDERRPVVSRATHHPLDTRSAAVASQATHLMSRVVTTYHQRVAQEKRALIVTAATALFLELGYDRTSLARIA
jgi:AcrR family transcriptional regulator